MSAHRVVRGDVSKIPLALFHMLGRAGLIWVGAHAFGRDLDFGTALAGAVGTEAFLIGYMAYKGREPKECRVQAVPVAAGPVAGYPDDGPSFLA